MTEQCFYSPKQNDLSLYQTVLFLTEMQHEILLLDIVAEIFQRPNRYLVTALSKNVILMIYILFL